LSLSAAALEIMLGKGLSLEDVIDIAKVIEAETTPPQPERSPAAERMARYRQHRRNSGLPPSFTGSAYVADLKARDGALCIYCQEVDGGVVDHMYPISRGGTDHLDNLGLACVACNGRKAGRKLSKDAQEIAVPTAREAYVRYVREHVRGRVREPKVSPTPPSKTTPIPPLKGGTFPKIPASPPEKPLSAWVEEIWAITPRPARVRTAKADIERSLKAAIRRDHDPAEVLAGLAAYFASEDATKDGCRYAKGTHRIIEGDRWQSFEELAPRSSTPPPDPMPGRIRSYRINGYWNSDWGPKPELEEQAA
jgi:5-methylcytosine-specific restriction endonuclease McrA